MNLFRLRSSFKLERSFLQISLGRRLFSLLFVKSVIVCMEKPFHTHYLLCYLSEISCIFAGINETRTFSLFLFLQMFLTELIELLHYK